MNNSADYARRYSEMSDGQLVQLVSEGLDNLTPPAREALERELQSRGLAEKLAKDLPTPCFVATDSERHVYRLKWWVRAGYLFLGILLGGSGLTLVAVAILNRGWPGGPDLRPFVAMILCSFLGYVFLSLALRSKVVLEGDRLTVRYAFGEDSAQISKIVGYRIVPSRTGKYWALKLRNGGSITILQSYAVDDYFRDFISQLEAPISLTTAPAPSPGKPVGCENPCSQQLREEDNVITAHSMRQPTKPLGSRAIQLVVFLDSPGRTHERYCFAAHSAARYPQ